MDFQRYLFAKKSVDDRALNQYVFDLFSKTISKAEKQTVLELGGGIGTMVQRLSQWLLTYDLDYTLMDIDSDNIKMAKEIVTSVSEHLNNSSQSFNKNSDNTGIRKQLRVKYLNADVYDLPKIDNSNFDGIIANAFFDLVDLDSVFPILRKLLKPDGWIYTSINFDGQTIFEPVIDEILDLKIINAYHASMRHSENSVSTANGSLTGRKLYSAFRKYGFEVKAIGSSDWVVFPIKNQYPADEKYFLESILFFIKDSVKPSDLLSEKQISDWLEIRKEQMEKGELFFIAHQLDYFATKLQSD